MADDILCSFLIGHTEYDMDFKPYEPGSETYNLENGIVLHNQMENGNYYIADSDGNPYLTAQEFFEHNHITDAILSEDGTRFCDLQGNILYPEWDYNYVSLVTDQYENINHRILCFSDSGSDDDHYVDLDNMEELELPTGYDEITYKTDTLFLLRNGNEYTIYDASSLITIDGSETPVDSPETVFVTDCEYPVVTVGEVFGTSSGSYILDPEGSLVLKADQEILYADSSCYMYYNNDQFFIQPY